MSTATEEAAPVETFDSEKQGARYRRGNVFLGEGAKRTEFTVASIIPAAMIREILGATPEDSVGMPAIESNYDSLVQLLKKKSDGKPPTRKWLEENVDYRLAGDCVGWILREDASGN